MKKIFEPIVFFGSGPVAAESLRLLAQDFNIEGVVTKPRPAHHHGEVPVIAVAKGLKLPTSTVSDKKELNKLFSERPYQSRVGVLIDFGIIVSQKVIDYFPLGIINSHFSILPQWRGADPLTFSILSGQKQTGVSLMLLTAGLDEGPLLCTTEFRIPSTMTTPELTNALIESSSQALRNMIPLYLSGKAEPAAQERVAEMMHWSAIPTYSRKLTKGDGLLDWTKPAEVLEREIRAYHEWPKSRGKVGSLELIVTKSHVINAQGSPGKPAVINKVPTVYCGQKALALDRLKPAGKQEMTGEAFLAGYKAQFLA